MIVLLVSLARRAYHFQQLASSSTPFHECRTYYLKSGLIKNSLKIISKQQFVDALYQDGEQAQLNNIEVLISRLRKKFAAVGHKELISTIRGQGYQFQIEAK